MTYTFTLAQFQTVSGLSEKAKEITSTQYELLKYIGDSFCAKLVSLNSIDLNDEDDQRNVNFLGALAIQRHLASTPSNNVMERAGGGAGAVMMATLEMINNNIDSYLIVNGWTMTDYSGGYIETELE